MEDLTEAEKANLNDRLRLLQHKHELIKKWTDAGCRDDMLAVLVEAKEVDQLLEERRAELDNLLLRRVT